MMIRKAKFIHKALTFLALASTSLALGMLLLMAVPVQTALATGDKPGIETAEMPATLQRAVSQTLGQETKLVVDDGAAGDQFGISVAILGNTTMVGARRSDDEVLDFAQGSVYAFTRNG